MEYGFTGTQQGMSPDQQQDLFSIFHRAMGIVTVHLGDCIGADEEAREIATGCGHRTVGHPPNNPRKRAFGKFTVMMPPAPYLTRNRVIVDCCELLIAAPREVIHDHCRHGTCSTVRYARSRGKDIVILERR